MRKPHIHLFRRGQLLRDIPCLITEIQYDLILDSLIEFVGMDIAAKYLKARLFILFQQRRTRKTNEYRLGHDILHRRVQFARLRAVALIDKNIQISLGLETRRQRLLQFLDILLIV